VCDDTGLPVNVVVSAGQRHESLFFEQVMDGVAIPRPGAPPRKRPRWVVGDKGYECPRIRVWVRRRHLKATIPEKRRRARRGRPCAFDREAYRRRNVIEECVGRLKENRRIATRYEKLALNFLSMVIIAMILQYLKTYS